MFGAVDCNSTVSSRIRIRSAAFVLLSQPAQRFRGSFCLLRSTDEQDVLMRTYRVLDGGALLG